MKPSCFSALVISLLSTTVMLGLLTVSCTDYTVIQLTDDSYHDRNAQINNNGWVVWSQLDWTIPIAYLSDIILYDGATMTQFGVIGVNREINDNGWVIWYEYEPGTSYIYGIWLYDGTTQTKIADSGTYAHLSNNGHVVWQGCDGTSCGPGGDGDYEIFLYDGTTTTKLTNNDYSDRYPQINDHGDVVWQGGEIFLEEIFLYDGTTTTQLTNNEHSDIMPQINNKRDVAWYAHYGTSKILLYDGTSTTQIANYDYWDESPQIKINDNGWVVWVENHRVEEGGYPDTNIYLYNGRTSNQVSDRFSYRLTDIGISNVGDVVWVDSNPDWSSVFLYDGIFTRELYPPLEECPSGFQIVTDAEINNRREVVWAGGCKGIYDGEIFLAKPTIGYLATANAEASTYGSESLTGSGVFNGLALLLVPVGTFVLLRIVRRKK